MPALRSSVLIIGHPDPARVAFGADFASDFDEAKEAITSFKYPVIALANTSAAFETTIEFLDYAQQLSPLTQRVVIQNETPAEGLRRIVNTGSVFRILPAIDDPRFDLTIQQALEEHALLQQNAKLLQLVNEQNERLKRLTTELEERVEARRKSLEDAKEKLLVTNHRVEALHRALVAIHRAGSIGEMERLINEALAEALELSWTRILFQSHARFETMLGGRIVALHSAPLTRGKEILGQIFFARPSEKPFMRDETSFLSQVAEAVSLAIDRLTKLEQSETLKHQWEATFDAILEPVSLITDDFTVVRINRAFADGSGLEPTKIIGKKCYEALFNRTSPCEGCAIIESRLSEAASSKGGMNFRLKPARTAGGRNAIYDVFSQAIHFNSEDRALYVNMYHDVSSQLRYERQILESAKMAELGTIGSSIAHELNNPLGGMLSFLQLIKMDLKGDEPWFEDIDEMEKGARRCRDIVQSLLGFTRKSTPESIDLLDLREVIEQALKITELQTRAMGITVRRELPEHPIQARGHFNALAQAFRNFLQNAQEAIAERIRSGDRTPGEITIRLRDDRDDMIVEIIDNGAGFDSMIADQIYDPTYSTKDPSQNPGLGLSVSQQIINDHSGRLEIRSSKGKGTWAIISLPRPVFDP